MNTRIEAENITMSLESSLIGVKTKRGTVILSNDKSELPEPSESFVEQFSENPLEDFEENLQRKDISRGELYRRASNVVREKLENGYYDNKEFIRLIEKEIGYRIYQGNKDTTDFIQYFNDKHDKMSLNSSASGGSGKKVYVDKGYTDSEEDYQKMLEEKYQQYKTQLENYADTEIDLPYYEEVFRYFVGRGKSPKTVFGAIAYSETDLFQTDICEAVDSTAVSVRKLYEEVENKIDEQKGV